MSGEQDWIDWVQKLSPAASAIGTTAAVIVSLVLASRAGRLNRSQQAEQVTAWFDGPAEEAEEAREGYLEVQVRIKNASDQMIYDLVAYIARVSDPVRVQRDIEKEHYLEDCIGRIGNVPPGEMVVRIRHPGHGMHQRWGIEFAFQDAAGRYWFRRANGILKQISLHPIDFYGMSRPVSWRS